MVSVGHVHCITKKHLCFHLPRNAAVEVKLGKGKVGSDPESKSLVFCGETEGEGQGLVTQCRCCSSVHTTGCSKQAVGSGEAHLPLCCLQAYMAYLTGMLRFEHQEWKAAMEAFNKCK